MSTYWRTVVLGGMLLLVPGPASAQAGNVDSAVTLRAQNDLARLFAELDRVNAEVAALKRADRSVRNDYRLSERMADAEALAQKVTQAERRLQGLRGGDGSPVSGRRTLVVPPQPSPQDGSVELEAKAGLFADQARKLVGEADSLATAAQQLRSRKVLRRQAGAWERDPFAGLESSKRNLSLSAQKSTTQGTAISDTGSRGPTASTTPTVGPVAGGASSPTTGGTATLSPSPPMAVTDSKGTTASSMAESATASKSSPSPQVAGTDRLTVEQRLFLDPATAAELRQVLGVAGAASDPDALDRAAVALRARARALNAEAQAMLAKSREP